MPRKKITPGKCRGCPEQEFCVDTRKNHDRKWCVVAARKKK